MDGNTPMLPFHRYLFGNKKRLHTGNLYTLSTTYKVLIPLYGIGIATALVVFQRVGKCGSITPEREVITGIGCQHHLATHIEAMEVALQGSRCHTHLMGIKIIT